MSEAASTDALRVLAANVEEATLNAVRARLEALGHTVLARELSLETVDGVIARDAPDVAFLGVGLDPTRTLQLVDRIVDQGLCPLVLALERDDPQLVRDAAEHGIFAWSVGGEWGQWQSAIEVARRRFSDFRSLEGAFVRRALVERAKGVLMDRHGIEEEAAYLMLRDYARAHNMRLREVATAILSSYRLLPRAE